MSTQHLSANYKDYLTQLSASSFSGEIRRDYAARLAVAVDNSIYQVIPQAVIFPKSTADIAQALTLAQRPRFHDITFSARGGGTGTNGQSLSAGIIVDCSKFMRAIVALNVAEGWVKVQPGVVLDQLNDYLYPHGHYFAPQISPSNRATLGGMINTDACGNGSKLLGRTSDHVVSLMAVLSNGRIINTSSAAADFASIGKLLQQHQPLIQQKFQAAARTLNGYNLAQAYTTSLNLNYLLCGSEGTLAIVSEATLKITSLPKFKKMMVIKYANFAAALQISALTAKINPLVIETIDENLLAIARQDAFYHHIKGFIDEIDYQPGAINLLEFIGDDEASLLSQLALLRTHCNQQQQRYYVTSNPVEIKLLWDLRKRAVALISKRLLGTRRPIPFIEDSAVAPEKLPSYINDLKQLLDSYQLSYGMYGHLDAGCIHVRPALDLTLMEDEALLKILSDKVVALLQQYQGVMWGEHGQGFRCHYGVEFFGETLYQVLRYIKGYFDPLNQLNPGKIATPLGSKQPLVTITGPLRAHYDRQIPANLQPTFSQALACNGNGACFDYDSAHTMCPSFKVTQDRIHSPKGRATLLREWLRQSALPTTATKPPWFKKQPPDDFPQQVYRALAGCLGCKACATQCPLSVDIPAYKATFLANYHQYYRRPWRDYLLGYIENLAPWQAKWPTLYNKAINSRWLQRCLKYALHIVNPPQLSIANATPQQLTLAFIKTLSATDKNKTVIIIKDPITAYYDGKRLTRIVKSLTSLGFKVLLTPLIASGKPLQVKGFLKAFTALAHRNMDYLQQLAHYDIAMISIDPSIALTYRDEYQKLVATKPLGFKIQLPQEWLLTQLTQQPQFKLSLPHQRYYLLSHCSEKSLCTMAEQQWQAIFTIFGSTLIPLTVGCCGMAGSYGYEAEHTQYSQQLFRMDWQAYLTDSAIDTQTIVATGFSCRCQVQRFTNLTLKHPLEILEKL